MSADPSPFDETTLRGTLEMNPDDWETRKQLVHLLYDRGSFQEAADLVWATAEIPSVDIELAFAARVLAKAAPRKAIRLLTALLEHNRGKAVQNLGLANALLHHGMVLQAARFYGAALEADPSLGNPELEHFILWTDDEETLWGDFKDRRPQLGELPWMKRDPMNLADQVSQHTTPVRVMSLQPSWIEQLNNEFYRQKAEKGAEPTPPPAVTIPLDQVDPKHRRFNSELGAPSEPVSGPGKESEPATPPPPAQKAVPIPMIQTYRKVTEPAKPFPADAPANRPKPTLPPLAKPDVSA